jgi:hypothetical protein
MRPRREVSVKWSRVGWVGFLAAWLWVALTASAAAQEAPSEGRTPINIDVMISHISDRVGQIDQRAKRLDERLRDEFRYESLEVLERHQMVLEVDEVGTVELPTGHQFKARPIDVDPRGVLMSVSVEGSVQTDVRVPSGHLVVIGAERYKDGKIVISVEPEY